MTVAIGSILGQGRAALLSMRLHHSLDRKQKFMMPVVASRWASFRLLVEDALSCTISPVSMASDSATAPWLQHHGTDTRAGRQQPHARWWGRASSCGHTLGSTSLSSHHHHVQGWSARLTSLHDDVPSWDSQQQLFFCVPKFMSGSDRSPGMTRNMWASHTKGLA